MRIAHLLILVTVLAVGLVSFVFVRTNQNAGATFVTAQRDAQTLTPQAVSRVVRAAPDPVTHARARVAACIPGGSGELRNPWQCVLRYVGKRTRWRVTVNVDGSYLGTDQLVLQNGTATREPGSITGCCIAVP